jgi:hypothetical protein
VAGYVAGDLLAGKLLRKLGGEDLAVLAADRAASAAIDGDSDEDRMLTGYQVVAGLPADQVDDAERLALRMAGSIHPYGPEDDPDLLSGTSCTRRRSTGLWTGPP